MKKNTKTRLMKDSIGYIEVPTNVYWGPQTQRSKQNFTINIEKMPFEIIKAITYVKKACAIANAKVGKLKQDKARAIIKVCDQILAGKLNDNFPLSIWQTGSGTQTNMNVNEVVAGKANAVAKNDKFIHPNDHVNMSQSSNDVFPTAIHLMVAVETRDKLLPKLNTLINELKKLVKKNMNIVKVGRTHLQDATPITLGQEMSAWVAMLETSKEMINDSLKYIYRLCIGGTAVGTGLNTPKGFDKMVCAELSKMIGIKFVPEANKFHGLSSKDAVSHYQSALKTLAESLIKIANDVRFLASGPNCGIGEITIPSNEPGSSIMPGKVNPTQCESLTMLSCQVIGNSTAVSIGNSMGNYQLNVFMPLMVYDVNQSINLLADGMDSFTRKCVIGIKPNLKRIEYNLGRNLMLVTALNLKIGYEKAADISKLAQKESITLKEAAMKLGYLSEKEFDKIVVPSKMVGRK